MGRVITGKLSRAANPVEEARRLLFAGRTEAAVARLHKILADNPKNHMAWACLALAENTRRDYAAALTAIKKAQALDPSRWSYRYGLAEILTSKRDNAEALPLLEALHEERPDDVLVLQRLNVATYYLGDRDRALAYGARVLASRDAASRRRQGPAPEPLAPDPAAGEPGRDRRVIAYSLWGDQAPYLIGAMINLRLSPYIMPGWVCRFYLGTGVPVAVARDLRDRGGEVIDAAAAFPGVPGYFWRFLVADDPTVELYLCRDCDSRLDPRDAAAVAAWQASGKAFHVLRDHVIHTELMLAGMWGGRGAAGLRMGARITAFLQGSGKGLYGGDQILLARMVWPVIRDRCLIHDRHYRLLGAQPYPVGVASRKHRHVGVRLVARAQLAAEARRFGLPWSG